MESGLLRTISVVVSFFSLSKAKARLRPRFVSFAHRRRPTDSFSWPLDPATAHRLHTKAALSGRSGDGR
jgi:hypothetical protein